MYHTVKVYITKNHKTNLVETVVNDHEFEKINNDKIKMHRLMNNLDIIANIEYDKEHKNGYCPKCFMLIPANGICECGYHKGGK